MVEYGCGQATRADLCNAARKHYNEISNRAMHYSTTIDHAIDAYEREPELLQILAERDARIGELCGLLQEVVDGVKGCDQVLLEDGTHYYEVGRVDCGFIEDAEKALSSDGSDLLEFIEKVRQIVNHDMRECKDCGLSCAECRSEHNECSTSWLNDALSKMGGIK